MNARTNALVSCERGSVAPLGIGLAALSLAAILTFSAASSLFVLQRRLATLAEASALSAAANGGAVQEFLTIASPLPFQNLRIANESMSDGVTKEVRLCSTWQSPLKVIGIPLTREICGYGAAR